MASISTPGIGSGLDIGGIVEQLVEAERQPQTFQLDRQESQLQAKISSYGIFKSSLSDFRSSFSGLLSSSQFSALQATSSDTDTVKVSASSNADVGSYNLESKQLAQSHSLVSAGFADANAVIGTGDITIKFGTTTYDSNTDVYTGFVQNASQGTLSLTIDSTNNTLVGLRDAINNAAAGVTASIIFDGTDHRLVMSSTETGASNSMEITVSDPSLSQFEFNATSTAMTQTQHAQDAILSINGLDVTNSSNKFDNALKGVTFDLQTVNLGKTVVADIAPSTSEIVSSLESFVETYNSLIENVDELTRYNPATGQASILLGEATVRSGMTQIRSIMSSMVSGLQNSSIRTLSDIGVSTELNGSLLLDTSKLKTALDSDPKGVEALFTVLGRPDNASVSYFSSTDTTPSGSYAVDVTQAATNGLLNSGTISNFTVTAGSNDTFTISLDGNSSNQITLTPGTYTGATLAAEIQARINGDTSIKAQTARIQVAYDSANNRFDLTSDTFGANSSVEITASTATTLGLNVAVGTNGQDVAGSIGGITAQGAGQLLTAANGLELTIDGGASGSLGTVQFSRGLMEELDNLLGGMLDSDGTLTAKTDGLQESLDLISDERLNLSDKMQKYEERLLSRFNAMDALLANLQGTSSFLSQQLESLPYNNLAKK